MRIKRGADMRIKRGADMRIKRGADMRIKRGWVVFLCELSTIFFENMLWYLAKQNSLPCFS